jgi:hypothetical protein
VRDSPPPSVSAAAAPPAAAAAHRRLEQDEETTAASRASTAASKRASTGGTPFTPTHAPTPPPHSSTFPPTAARTPAPSAHADHQPPCLVHADTVYLFSYRNSWVGGMSLLLFALCLLLPGLLGRLALCVQYPRSASSFRRGKRRECG